MKVLVFIDHDIMVRHFIHSGVFSDLERTEEVVYVFPEPGYKRIKGTDFEALHLKSPRLHLPVSNERLQRWQHIMIANTMRWRPGKNWKGLRVFRRYAINDNRKQWSRLSVAFVLKSLPGLFWWFKKRKLKQIAAIPNQNLEELLIREKPDVIVHPTVLAGVYIDDLIDHGRRFAIPVIAIMNSWDNPATKSSVVGHPDRLLVWGEQTKRDAIRYMRMPAQRIDLFGAAQFEVYKQRPYKTREQFLEENELRDDEPILLYAGSSKGTDEFSHLRMLEQAVASGRLGRLQILYRPHPWGLSESMAREIWDHPWSRLSIDSSMVSYVQSLTAGDSPSMTSADYRDTHVTLSYVDMLISPLSTIILEAALHGKPVACFLPDDKKHDRHFDLVLPFAHFDAMLESPEVVVVRKVSRLIEGVAELDQRASDPETPGRMKAMSGFFIQEFDRPYSERIVEYLHNVVQDYKSTRE